MTQRSMTESPGLNPLLLLGVALNAALGVMASVTSESSVFAMILGPLVAVCVAGLVLISAGKAKAGAITVMIGSFGFVPLGLIAVLGARKVLDELEAQRFNARRASVR